VSLGSSDLELVRDSDDQTVGVRFAGVPVPRRARIVAAYVQLKVDETGSTPTVLTVAGQASDDAATFTSATRNVSSRPRTTSVVTWSPEPWTSVGAAGLAQRTPDLAPIIQEIVDRAEWASGRALALIVTGTGKRVADSYDGDRAGAPLLHVEYSFGG
jgi:hypothetical protein